MLAGYRWLQRAGHDGRRWSGQVKNVELDKCDLLTWCDEDELPPNTVPYVRAALDQVRQGQTFSQYEWSEPAVAPPAVGTE